MKNITFRADASVIKPARAATRLQHKSLESAFREWLKQDSDQAEPALRFDALMK
jgi:hypothetical protein